MIVGPITPLDIGTHVEYISVAAHYLTKWVKAKATPKNDARTTTKFPFQYIINRYGFPIELASNQGTLFINEVIACFNEEFMITHKRSAPYRPQDKGQVQRTQIRSCAQH